MALVRFEKDRSDAPGGFSENDGTADLTKDIGIVYDAAITDISMLDIMDHAEILLDHYLNIELSDWAHKQRFAMIMHSGSDGIFEETAESNDLGASTAAHIGLEIDVETISGAAVAGLVKSLIGELVSEDFPRP